MASKSPETGGGAKNGTLKVRVNLLERQKDTDIKGATAYAYTKGGRLVARAEIGDNGVAKLSVPLQQEAMTLNVIAGPADDGETPEMSHLLRRGAVRQTVRIDPDIAQAEAVIDVIPDHWLCWFLSRCYVPGQLTKRVELDGMKIDLPVCGVDIEVYEVDPIPLIVARLPDTLIERIRRWVIEPDPWPLDVHLPEARRTPLPQPPRPDFIASEALAAEMDTANTARDSLPADSFASGGQTPASIPTNLQIAAQTASLSQFRDALIRAPDLSRFLICRYVPGGVSMQLVATATTDECGRFRASFFRGCRNPDTPDLYFKAIRRFGPFSITIREPKPVACYTHWNYACGTEVKLTTSHALAPTCPPCQPLETPADDWVAVMHIGNLPLSRVRGASANSTVSGSTNGANEGMVFLTEGEALAAASFDGRPMGGLLRPHLEFDSGLRAKGIRYYLFSWRKGTTGAFQPLDQHEVHRHYSYEVSGVSEPVFEVYSLGPKNVNGKTLYEIPPALPPSGIWVYPDIVENTTSAKFPSEAHAPDDDDAGKYQLKIELFDASGTIVDIDAPASKVTFVVPEELDLSLPATVHTVDADGLGLVATDGPGDSDGLRSFILTLHIDNSFCTGAISPAALSSPANACGVLPYNITNTGATVSMPFTALHPNGMATYEFTLKRGVTGLPDQTIGGSSPLTAPRAVAPGNFSQSASVATLTQAYPALGLPQCSMAAFSERVRVWAMATNGWRRLHEKDAQDHGAFVLAPHPSAS